MWPSTSTTAWLALRLSAVKRGTILRKSVLANPVVTDCAREVALPQRTERHKSDAQFVKRRQNLPLRLPPPERIFALQGGDRLDGMSMAYNLNTRLGKTEVLDLALVGSVFHRAGHVLDGDGGSTRCW